MPLLDWSVDCAESSDFHLDVEQKFWFEIGFFDGTGFGIGEFRDAGELDGTSTSHPGFAGYPDGGGSGDGRGDGYGNGYGNGRGGGHGWGSGDGDGGLDGSGLG